MEPIDNQRNRTTDPSNVSQNPPHKSNTEEIKDGDKHGTPVVDLDKTNVADRKHGRLNDSLGPDHEPGTV